MFRTRLGAHSIVYGAEMDGLEVNDRLKGLTGDVDGIDLNGETFVELKTSRIVEHPGQVAWIRNFSEELLYSSKFCFSGEDTEEVQADQVVVPVFSRRGAHDCLRIQGRRWDRRKSGTGGSNDSDFSEKDFLVNMSFLKNCRYSLLQYSVNDLPKSCSEHWQPNVCMGFLDAALAHIKTEMSQGMNGISHL